MKNAIVTGGGSGIGRAIATRLADDGLRVVVLDNSLEAAQALVAELTAAGKHAEAVECDVSDLESVRRAFASIDEIDVLVNNAGIASIGNVEATTPEEFERVYSVNVKGVYHCLHLALPKMVARQSGAILNLASIASKLGIADRFAYSMSKGAVHSMTLSVARDYVDKGIRSNCICPARVHTPFVDNYLEQNYPEDQRAAMFEKLSQYQPIGRMGTPEEIAELAAFLCSDKAAFITGASYDIDGGVTQLR